MFKRRRKKKEKENSFLSTWLTNPGGDLKNSNKYAKHLLSNRVTLFRAVILMSLVVLVAPSFATKARSMLEPLFDTLPDAIKPNELQKYNFDCPGDGRDLSKFGERISYSRYDDSDLLPRCNSIAKQNHCNKIKLNAVNCINSNKNKKMGPTWDCEYDFDTLVPLENFQVKLGSERIICSDASERLKEDMKIMSDVCTPCQLKYDIERIEGDNFWENTPIGSVFEIFSSVMAQIAKLLDGLLWYCLQLGIGIFFFLVLQSIYTCLVSLTSTTSTKSPSRKQRRGRRREKELEEISILSRFIAFFKNLSPLTMEQSRHKKKRIIEFRTMDTDSESGSDSDSDSDFLGGRKSFSDSDSSDSESSY